jgi:hypothetical protein
VAVLLLWVSPAGAAANSMGAVLVPVLLAVSAPAVASVALPSLLSAAVRNVMLQVRWVPLPGTYMQHSIAQAQCSKVISSWYQSTMRSNGCQMPSAGFRITVSNLPRAQLPVACQLLGIWKLQKQQLAD